MIPDDSSLPTLAKQMWTNFAFLCMYTDMTTFGSFLLLWLGRSYKKNTKLVNELVFLDTYTICAAGPNGFICKASEEKKLWRHRFQLT